MLNQYINYELVVTYGNKKVKMYSYNHSRSTFPPLYTCLAVPIRGGFTIISMLTHYFLFL